MKAVFEVVRKVRDWLRSEISDPSIRLFHTWNFIVMGLIYLMQERLPQTRQEILRATSLSSSSVHRGLGFMIELGIIKQTGNIYEFAVVVPKDILEISTGDSRVTMAALDDLKRFIVGELRLSGIPNDRVQDMTDLLTQYKPKIVKERKGTKKRLGDALL